MKKRILLFALLIATSIYVIAQQTNKKPTKEETKNWIIEKLSKYTLSSPSNVVNKFYDYKFKFEGDDLVFTYKSSQKESKGTWTYEKRCNHIVHFSSISFDSLRFDWTTPSTIYFVGKPNSVKDEEQCSTSSGEPNSLRSSDDEDETYNYGFYLNFNLDSEKDIFSRLNKAFKTLKSYSKQKSEAF